MIYFKHQNIGNSNRFPNISFLPKPDHATISWITVVDFQVEFTEQYNPCLCTGWGEKSVMTSELVEDWE